ncbi:MAG TPA: ProQ/FinO family protein [Rhodocyclaceae bacterium]|nr:ProQ/FinO family protein [Rhodocyclaceae bacterium]
MTDASSTSPAAPAGPTPAQAARALIKRLQAEFKVFREHQPLAIGIDKQIVARLPEVPKKTLRMALGFHTHSQPYLNAMSNATVRYDLDGNPGDAVPEEHRAHALEELKTRMKKQAEQHKAERAAKAAEEQRSAKLNALAEKFGKHR